MKTNMKFKKVISIFTVLVILLSFAGVTVSAKSVSEAKNSVVVVMNSDGSYGTGFAIGEVGKPIEYIATNNHIVEGENGNTTATVIFDLASNDAVLANVYFYDAVKDVAVLKLPQPTEKREAMVLCPMEYVDLDDAFAALGYPGDQVTDWPKYNTDDITVTKGGIKKADRIEGQDVYMLDLSITHGNSGGPLVNSDGEVVGINTFSVHNDNYAIAIDELLNVIGTDRIPVTLHGQINWLLIVGAVVLLLIIALVVVLIVKRKDSGKTVYGPTPVQPGMGAGAAPTQGRNTRPSAKIIGIGGVMSGKRYSISGSVKLGRDASNCAIAFPVNTQGVSGIHCEITFDGTVFYIKDLNSTYGTFLQDGRKLVPNVPQMLKSGEKFYLASPENTFEVRF